MPVSGLSFVSSSTRHLVCDLRRGRSCAVHFSLRVPPGHADLTLIQHSDDGSTLVFELRSIAMVQVGLSGDPNHQASLVHSQLSFFDTVLLVDAINRNLPADFYLAVKLRDAEEDVHPRSSCCFVDLLIRCRRSQGPKAADRL